MDNNTIKNAVEKADRWYQYQGRVILATLGEGSRLAPLERVASFPVENLTHQNWAEIEELKEIESEEGVKDERKI